MDNGFCCGNWFSSLESEDGLDVLVAEREVMVSGVGLAMERQWRDSEGYDDHEPCRGGLVVRGMGLIFWVLWFESESPPFSPCSCVFVPLWRENVGLVRMISGLNPRD